ncbi:MAG: hypothetical protein VX589_04070 [Myxococcota bacterium]|nr:hypothetical protein [Myxococcota bacterium]
MDRSAAHGDTGEQALVGIPIRRTVTDERNGGFGKPPLGKASDEDRLGRSAASQETNRTSRSSVYEYGRSTSTLCHGRLRP